jgi:hypothetical protein
MHFVVGGWVSSVILSLSFYFDSFDWLLVHELSPVNEAHIFEFGSS